MSFLRWKKKRSDTRKLKRPESSIDVTFSDSESVQAVSTPAPQELARSNTTSSDLLSYQSQASTCSSSVSSVLLERALYNALIDSLESPRVAPFDALQDRLRHGETEVLQVFMMALQALQQEPIRQQFLKQDPDPQLISKSFAQVLQKCFDERPSLHSWDTAVYARLVAILTALLPPEGDNRVTPGPESSVSSSNVNCGPNGLQMHQAVWFNNEAALADLLFDDSSRATIDTIDYRGNTPLHLAVKLCHPTMVRMLLEHGADPKIRNKLGWTALDEAVCSGNEEIVTCVYVGMQRRAWSKWQSRKHVILEALDGLPDFHMELKWEFDSSMMPFVNNLAPSDVYTIWKKGSSVRIDTTLVGFDSFKCIRGKVSLLFMGSNADCPGEVFVIDREEKTVMDALHKLRDPSPDELKDEVHTLMKSDLMQGKFNAKNLTFTPVKTLLGNVKTESVGEWRNAKYYEASGVFAVNLVRKKVTRPPQRPPNAVVGRLPPRDPLNPPDMPSFDEYFDSTRVPSDIIDESQLQPDETTKSLMRFAKRSSPHMAGKTVKATEFKRKMRATVWLYNDFPLPVKDLVPVLEVLAKTSNNKYLKKIKDLLSLQFPPGMFPVKVSIPLMLSVHAIATFTKFELTDSLSDEVFLVPKDFKPKVLGQKSQDELLQSRHSQKSRSDHGKNFDWKHR